MAKQRETGGTRSGVPWRMIGWSIAALPLLAALVAMQFTSEVNWTAFDFIFAAVLIGGVGLLFELTVRMSDNWFYRGGVAAALTASFLIVWANGAVGMIGDEDNPYNLLFVGVILLALVGGIAVRFRASGMALVMAAAAIAHGCVALVGMSSDLRGGIFSAMSAAMWAVSAALFASAAGDSKAAAPAR